MSDRIFRKMYELREHIESLKHGIQEYEEEKKSIERNISSMSARLRTRELELERREREEAQDKVNSAQRELDILNGKKVGPPKEVPIVCGKKCPSGYMPDCGYNRGHLGVCEGQYDSVMVDQLNRSMGR